MTVNELGMVIDVKLRHCQNTACPNDVKELGRLMDDKCVQVANALPPIVLTVFGNVIVSSPVQ